MLQLHPMKTVPDEILTRYSPLDLIEQLAPYLTEERKARIDAVIQHRLTSIQLAIESPSDINNALAAIRTAEALGVSQIHLISPEGNAGAAKQITQGAIYWVDVIYHPHWMSFLSLMRSKSALLAGGIIGSSLTLTEVPVDQPLCLLIGNESRGLSHDARSACDYLYSIPMMGMSESLNLSVSAGISLYEVTSRRRQLLEVASDLNPMQQTELRAKYFIHSIQPRLLHGLFP